MASDFNVPDACEAAAVWINEVMNMLKDKVDPSSMELGNGVESGLSAYFGPKPVTKKIVVEFAIKSWSHVARQNQLLRRLKKENEELNSKVIKSQEQQILLQAKLLEAQDKQISGIGSAVESTVKSSLKNEMKMYSEAAQSSEHVISADAARTIVKSFTEQEERASNAMVFGLAEKKEEGLESEVEKLFAAIDEKPKILQVSRVGKDTDTGRPRPVRVKLRSPAAATTLVRKAKKLNELKNFYHVFITPDRSLEERAKQRELVKEMMDRRMNEKEFSTKWSLIRGGKVITIDQPYKRPVRR